jgi:serine acetyltransferase
VRRSTGAHGSARVSFLEHPVGVIVGDGVVAGSNLVLGAGTLLGANSFYESRTRPRVGFPTLGDDVFVFAKASIIGPVDVGDRAVIEPTRWSSTTCHPTPWPAAFRREATSMDSKHPV